VTNSNNNAETIGRGTLTVIDIKTGALISIDLEESGFDPDTQRGCNPQAVIVFEELGEVHVVCSGIIREAGTMQTTGKSLSSPWTA
jgi:hypothetical protein